MIELYFCDDAKESLTLDKECMVAERIFWIHRISEAMSECLHRFDWGGQTRGLQKTSEKNQPPDSHIWLKLANLKQSS